VVHIQNFKTKKIDFMAFDAQVTQLSAVDLDKMFDAAPNNTPNADNLVIGKQEQESIKINTNATTGIADIPNFDDSLLATDEEESEDEKTSELEKKAEEEVEENKKVSSKKAKAAEQETQKTDDPEEDENKEETNASAVKEVLKNTVEYLVNQGLWADFEGRDGLEINEEVYADLAIKQAQHTAYEIVNELIDSTGPYGKAIISHIKNGGRPDEIIDIFKEQKSIEQIDTSTDDGKKAKIEKYYTDVLGWKPQKVQKVVNRLIEENDLESEFQDVEEQFDEHYNKKLQAVEEERQAAEFENKRRQEVFVNNIRQALDEDPALNTRDKNLIASSILDFRHRLDNGQKVNDFYLKFAEMQSDPKKYIKLVRFVMDSENYEKQIQVQEKTKASKEIFSFIKGNQAISKVKSQQIETNENLKTNKRQGTDFSFLVKN